MEMVLREAIATGGWRVTIRDAPVMMLSIWARTCTWPNLLILTLILEFQTEEHLPSTSSAEKEYKAIFFQAGSWPAGHEPPPCFPIGLVARLTSC